MRHGFLLRVATTAASMFMVLPAIACSYPVPKPFSQELRLASSVLIVRLESAHLQESGLVLGKIRIVQSLKAPKNKVRPYEAIQFSTRSCGGLRLDVGHYFLVATDDDGSTIQLGPSDQSIIDLTGYYKESRKDESSRTALLHPIYDFLAGRPLPEDFPPDHVSSYTSTLLPPPPPPDH